MNNQIFTQRLKESIESSELSLAEIAKRTGISVRSLKKYLYAGVLPSLCTFCKLKDAIPLHADYILQIGKYKEIHSPSCSEQSSEHEGSE